MVNWAQIHTKNITAIVYRGPSHTLHFKKKPQTGLPSLLSCTLHLPSESTLIKKVPRIKIQPIRLRLSPIQLDLHNYLLICIFTIQSGWFHSDQSGQCYLDQSNCEDLESSFAQKWINQGMRVDTLLYISQLHLCFNGVYFQVPSRIEFPWS